MQPSANGMQGSALPAACSAGAPFLRVYSGVLVQTGACRLTRIVLLGGWSGGSHLHVRSSSEPSRKEQSHPSHQTPPSRSLFIRVAQSRRVLTGVGIETWCRSEHATRQTADGKALWRMAEGPYLTDHHGASTNHNNHVQALEWDLTTSLPHLDSGAPTNQGKSRRSSRTSENPPIPSTRPVYPSWSTRW